MMTYFRKRFTAEDIAAINEELHRRTHPPKDEPPRDGGNCGLHPVARPQLARLARCYYTRARADRYWWE